MTTPKVELQRWDRKARRWESVMMRDLVIGDLCRTDNCTGEFKVQSLPYPYEGDENNYAVQAQYLPTEME